MTIPNILLPRGIRNNNPGNIRRTSQIWQGQKKEITDPAFVEFETPVFGLRALMRLLIVYQLKYGLDTVESIINRFAPPHENATDHYIRAVAKALNVRRFAPINVCDFSTMATLARAIVNHENGNPRNYDRKEWYAESIYTEAARLSLLQQKENKP